MNYWWGFCHGGMMDLIRRHTRDWGEERERHPLGYGLLPAAGRGDQYFGTGRWEVCDLGGMYKTADHKTNIFNCFL